MKVLGSFFLSITLCAAVLVGCGGDSPTTNQMQTVDGIQIISPDQGSVLVAGRVEEVIFVATSQKLIQSYRVFLCGEIGTTDQEILGSIQVLPNFVLYHGIIPPELNGTYTIRVDAYSPGPNAVLLLSATSEPFTIIPSFQDGSGGTPEVVIDQPDASTIWYTDSIGWPPVEARVFDSEKCPVAWFGVNVYVSSNGNSWHYMPIQSSADGHEHGQFYQGVDTPSDWFGDNFQIKLEAWTFGGAFMLATGVSEPFSIQRRNTGIFSISEPNQQTAWQYLGVGSVSGYLVDEGDNPVGDNIIYCDNGQCSWDVQIPDLSHVTATNTYKLYVFVSYADKWNVFAMAISEPFTIQ